MPTKLSVDSQIFKKNNIIIDNMLQIIIFSFNRAMQLDYLLKSILKKLNNIDYKIAIIYHTTGNHKQGYNLLISKYVKISSIEFIERKKQPINILSYLPTFSNFTNIKKYLKFSYVFNRESDNFKKILENLLKKTKCEFTMFNTDDGFYFDDIVIPHSILNQIKNNPLQSSYRLYLGDNIDGFPDYVKLKNNEYYEWDYYTNDCFNHWTCMFSVDGTIYHTKNLLNIIRKVPYHNPITLEAFVYDYTKSRNYFGQGLSPKKSCLVCTKLNRVSNCSLNPTISISTDFLNLKFLSDFELKITIPEKVTNANIVPNEVALTKKDEVEIIYKLDHYGQKVQNALGAEGTKYIVD